MKVNVRGSFIKLNKLAKMLKAMENCTAVNGSLEVCGCSYLFAAKGFLKDAPLQALVYPVLTFRTRELFG